MKGRDEIKDLFSDKLGAYEVKVNPELWGKVASQIGAGSAATVSGITLTTKLIVGLGIAGVIAATSFVILNNEEEVKTTKTFTQDVVKEESPTIHTALVDTLEKTANKEATESKPVISLEETSVEAEKGAEPSPILNIKERLRLEDDPLQNVFTPKDQLEAPKTGEPILPSIEPDRLLENKSSEDIISSESTEIRVVFPNVFTPNNDGVNDLLFISNPEDLEKDGFSVRIIDESYNLVYQSDSPYFEWNGNDLSGKPLQSGNYIALIMSKDSKGKEAKPVMYQFQIRK